MIRSSQSTLPTTQAGFTLMEVLLAISLCSVILSAAFSAVHLSWKYRTAGENQIEQSQILRGVVQDMTLDLRAAVNPPDQSSAMTDALTQVDGLPPEMAAIFQSLIQKESASIQPEGGSRIEELVLEFESLETIEPVHFYGDSSSFAVLNATQNYRFTHANATHSQERHIVWGRADKPIRTALEVHSDRLKQTTLNSPPETTGLIRMEQSFDVRSTNQQHRKPHCSSIVPDATKVSFRYSDGSSWHSNWNSHATKSLPTAVEFNLERQHDTPHRVVIRLPQSSPRNFVHQ